MEDIAYHYFDVSPPEGVSALTLESALDIIKSQFSEIEEDEQAAIDNAKARHDALSALSADPRYDKVPQEIIDIYADPKVTRIRIPDTSMVGYYVEFDLWDCQGISVYPKPDEDRLAESQVIAQKLADALSYELKVEVYD